MNEGHIFEAYKGTYKFNRVPKKVKSKGTKSKMVGKLPNRSY